MKIKIQNLFVILTLLLPLMARAQFTFTTNGGAITITGYNTNAGLNVVIPASINGYPVTSIGTNAFYNLTTITNVTIPNSVTTIGDEAFVYCGLTSVTIGNSVTAIGDGAFDRCSGLTSVTIPNSVTTIGFIAFGYCSGLRSATIGKSVTTIGTYAFYYCSGLPSVTIPNNVTTIGEDAFAWCSGLTSVTIGNSVTTISDDAFYECSGLHQAFFQGNAPLVNGRPGSADSTVFSGETGTAYYVPGTTGWSATFGGWPTAQWYQPQPQILGSGNGLGVTGNQFNFTISWATNTAVVVLASTDLLTWTPVNTNTLINGMASFSDPQWTNYPQRFYRVHSP